MLGFRGIGQFALGEIARGSSAAAAAREVTWPGTTLRRPDHGLAHDLRRQAEEAAAEVEAHARAVQEREAELARRAAEPQTETPATPAVLRSYIEIPKAIEAAPSALIAPSDQLLRERMDEEELILLLMLAN